MKTAVRRNGGKDSTAGSRLGRIDKIIPGKTDISKRAWLRHCESEAAPWGIELGARRLWDLDVVDSWIQDGCSNVRKERVPNNFPTFNHVIPAQAETSSPWAAGFPPARE